METNLSQLPDQSESAIEGSPTASSDPALISVTLTDNVEQSPGELSTAVDNEVEPAVLPTPAEASPASAKNDESSTTDSPQFEVDAVEALVKLILGGAIEGTDQLMTRLQAYEIELLHEESDGLLDPEVESAEDRLRFAFVGFVLEAQAALRRNTSLIARALDRTYVTSARFTSPVRDSALFRPFQNQFERLVARGEGTLARWVTSGRQAEPHSRKLATKAYLSLVNEFISELADNPEIQDVVTQQGVGMAYDIRDDVRERTVTADNILEGMVRRILRRSPRTQLPIPPPEVQQWAGTRLGDYKALEKSDADQKAP